MLLSSQSVFEVKMSKQGRLIMHKNVVVILCWCVASVLTQSETTNLENPRNGEIMLSKDYDSPITLTKYSFNKCDRNLINDDIVLEEHILAPISKSAKKGYEGQIILVSTLNGSLVAISSTTGDVIWSRHEESVVKSSYDILDGKPVVPTFIPDPKDGSLYRLGHNPIEPLKKLPFTVPELVSGSPSRSSDGTLYAGSKFDNWLTIDRFTGESTGGLSPEGCITSEEGITPDGENNMCPNLNPSSFLLGRTEYNMRLFNYKHFDRHWDVTFHEYAASKGNPDIIDKYDLEHYADCSGGSLAALNKRSGELRWNIQIGSPVVGLYLVEGDGIVDLPVTSVSKETLSTLINHINDPRRTCLGDANLTERTLHQKLYIGEHKHGLYAMPSLIDQQLLDSPIINRNQLSFEERQNFRYTEETKSVALRRPIYQAQNSSTIYPEFIDSNINKFPEENSLSCFIFGHFDVPGISNIGMLPSNQYLANSHLLGESYSNGNNKEHWNFDGLSWVYMEKTSIAILTLVVILVLITNFKDNMAVESVLGHVHSFIFGEVTSSPRVSISNYNSKSLRREESQDNIVKVGSISFDPERILGKGCDGTFVFKGTFDNRKVAVKRLLNACFNVADREVEILRESDQHPNVIRYYCMEKDRQFRYIALEYCSATLQDYVEGSFKNGENQPMPQLNPLSIIRQATLGLHHLHSLDICHRDIKPQNILLSMPGKNGDVRVMISDFGLCKKMKVGRMSFSRQSGIAGTEGWIAPELMLSDGSTTCSVDIFSLGCVYYYVLTNGCHPFGEAFKRQANILEGEYTISELMGQNSITEVNLVKTMINMHPNNRPPTSAILKHPTFWRKEKILNFLQDVSDRLDSEDKNSAVVMSIERNSCEVIRNNWYSLLDPEITEDLRARRTYDEKRVTGLLRALRNKKHHYQELKKEIKSIYGRMPDEFADYWLCKFPKLLIHSWISMNCVKNEPTFLKYYDKHYEFLEKYRKEEIAGVGQLEDDDSRSHNCYIFGSRVNRGDAELDKFPHQYVTPRIQTEDDDENGVLDNCLRKSSLVYSWEERIVDKAEKKEIFSEKLDIFINIFRYVVSSFAIFSERLHLQKVKSILPSSDKQVIGREVDDNEFLNKEIHILNETHNYSENKDCFEPLTDSNARPKIHEIQTCDAMELWEEKKNYHNNFHFENNELIEERFPLILENKTQCDNSLETYPSIHAKNIDKAIHENVTVPSVKRDERCLHEDKPQTNFLQTNFHDITSYKSDIILPPNKRLESLPITSTKHKEGNSPILGKSNWVLPPENGQKKKKKKRKKKT